MNALFPLALLILGLPAIASGAAPPQSIGFAPGLRPRVRLRLEKRHLAANVKPLAMAFRPDGKALAIVWTDGRLRMWDLSACRLQASIRLRAGPNHGSVHLLLAPRTAVCYYPSDNQLAPEDFSLVRINLALRQARPCFPSLRPSGTGLSLNTGHDFPPTPCPTRPPLALSADGKLLALAGILSSAPDEAPTVEVYECTSEKKVVTLANPGDGIPAFSPDGRFLAVAVRRKSELRTQLVDIPSGRIRQTLATPATDKSDPLVRVLVSSDGRVIAVLTERCAYLWERASGQLINTVTFPQGYCWHDAVLTLDGRLLLAGVRAPRSRDSQASYLFIWPATRPERTWRVCAPSPGVRLALAPHGRLLAVSQADHSLLLYDLPASTEPGQILKTQELDSLWHQLGSRLASRAWKAQRQLAAHPDQALVLLSRHLAGAQFSFSPQLLVELNADEFQVRERATKHLAAALTKGDSEAELALRELLASGPPLEVRRRILRLLRPYDKQALSLSPESLRTIRAVAVLEWLGNKKARSLLRQCAKVGPALVQLEARAALERLHNR